METAIVSIICLALIVVGGMTMSQGFLTSVDTSTAELGKLTERDEAIMRTELTSINATLPAANTMEVSLRNNGQTKLTSFSKWDVIVQYYDSGGSYYIKWLSYTANVTPGDNEWAKKGIYQDAGDETTEAFETDILNPGEEMKITAQLNPAVGVDTVNLVVISTPNGIPVSTSFSP